MSSNVRTGAEARGLARPTVVGWLEEIAGVVGPQQALLAWSRATRATGLHGMALTPEQMRVVGQRLADDATDPRLRLAVRSCLLRLRVHGALDTTGGARR
ncbi:hypothetical protein [Kineococcus esterisolvens]|uniref:hypothetical protein n=1 Tax=unclassified Kineococcus TaxID=2621656 RepID=UPI003D7EA465